MKKTLLLVVFALCFSIYTQAQEYADFEITGTNVGTGTFTSYAALSNFTWAATGTINGDVEILDNETFDDGNIFETTFGQADDAENIRIQNYPNGSGTIGTPVLSISELTINFDQLTPVAGWGFCVLDIDVENCLISAIDANDDPVLNTVIDTWLLELFDADLITDGVNIPKWDATNAALLGAGTASAYTVYSNIVQGGLPDSEAAGAFFMPNIPLKSITIMYENLQDLSFVSYHFFIASESSVGIAEQTNLSFSLSPNPGKSKIFINTSILDLHDTTLTIFDMNAKELIEEKIPKGSKSFEIDVSTIPSGIYCCKLTTKTSQLTKKLIIE